MKECPECGSEEYNPDGPFSKPLINLGGKETYKSCAIRRYVCVCCGYKFYSIEKHWKEIPHAEEIDLDELVEERQ